MSDINPNKQESGIKFTITDCSNLDKWCSGAHFLSSLSYYYCKISKNKQTFLWEKNRVGFMRLDSTNAETLFCLPSTITTYFHSRSSNKSKVELLFHLVEGPSQLQCSSIAYLDFKSNSSITHLDFSFNSFKLHWCSIVCGRIFYFLWNLKITTTSLKSLVHFLLHFIINLGKKYAQHYLTATRHLLSLTLLFRNT